MQLDAFEIFHVQRNVVLSSYTPSPVGNHSKRVWFVCFLFKLFYPVLQLGEGGSQNSLPMSVIKRSPPSGLTTKSTTQKEKGFGGKRRKGNSKAKKKKKDLFSLKGLSMRGLLPSQVFKQAKQ